MNTFWTFLGSNVEFTNFNNVSIEPGESFLQNRDEGLGVSTKFVVLNEYLFIKV